MGKNLGFEWWINVYDWALPLSINFVKTEHLFLNGRIETDYGVGLCVLCFHFTWVWEVVSTGGE